MARTRYLKPGFNKDEDVADLSAFARLFFLGMLGHADCRGVVEDRPKFLKAEILPHDQVDPEALLEELTRPRRSSKGPFVLRYTGSDGKRYLLVRNFTTHQKCHPDEKPTPWPLPEGLAFVDRKVVEISGDIKAAKADVPTAGQEATTGKPGEPAADQGPTTGQPPGSKPCNLDLDLEPEQGTGTTAAVVAAGESAGGKADSPPTGGGNIPPPPDPVRIPRCVQALPHGPCNAELRREQGRYASSPTKGKGWRCPAPKDGGCGRLYPREDPVVLEQLSDAARSALFRELGAEEAAQAGEAKRRRKQIREAEPVETRAARAIVAQMVLGEGDPWRHLWGSVLGRLERIVNRHTFSTWFRPTHYLGSVTDADGPRLVVEVPDANFRDWLMSNYATSVAAAIEGTGEAGPGLGVFYVTVEEAAEDAA